MSYCGNCGAQIHEGQTFCSGCGARPTGDAHAAQLTAAGQPVSTEVVASQQSSEAILQKLARLNAQTPPPTKSSGKRILIAVLVVLLVGAIAALAGAVYVGYRVKQK